MNNYLFRYGFEVGKTIRYKIETTGSFRLSGPMGEESTPIGIDMIMNQVVDSCEGDKAIIKVTIEKATSNCDIPKDKMPVAGSFYKMEMDSLGNSRWLEGSQGWPGSEHSMMIFPEPEIEIGDTWIQKMEETSGSAVSFFNKYRLNGRDRRNTDLVNFSTDIFAGNPNDPKSRNVGKGSFSFNYKDKWVQDSDVRIKYEYVVPVPKRPDILLLGRTILNVDMERI